MPTAVSSDEICSRIDVTPPYYDLRDVTRADDGTVQATVVAGQRLVHEVRPIGCTPKRSWATRSRSGRCTPSCGSAISRASVDPKL